MRFRPADQRARRTAEARCEPARGDRFALGVSLPPATEFRQRIRRSLRVVGGRVSSAAVTEFADEFDEVLGFTLDGRVLPSVAPRAAAAQMTVTRLGCSSVVGFGLRRWPVWRTSRIVQS